MRASREALSPARGASALFKQNHETAAGSETGLIRDPPVSFSGKKRNKKFDSV
jgi:hypothetical protein